MRHPDRGGEGKVPDEELAEIARQLRGVLAETGDDAPHKAPPPSRPARVRRAVSSETVVLRFAGAFVVPGLILVAIALLSDFID